MRLQKGFSKKKFKIKNYFCWHLFSHWQKKQDPDPEPDPYKMSRIHNTARNNKFLCLSGLSINKQKSQEKPWFLQFCDVIFDVNVPSGCTAINKNILKEKATFCLNLNSHSRKEQDPDPYHTATYPEHLIKPTTILNNSVPTSGSGLCTLELFIVKKNHISFKNLL